MISVSWFFLFFPEISHDKSQEKGKLSQDYCVENDVISVMIHSGNFNMYIFGHFIFTHIHHKKALSSGLSTFAQGFSLSGSFLFSLLHYRRRSMA